MGNCISFTYFNNCLIKGNPDFRPDITCKNQERADLYDKGVWPLYGVRIRATRYRPPFLLPSNENAITIRIMKSNPDIKKVVRQHAEMAEFFSGGLTVKKTSLVSPKRDSAKGFVAGDSPASALAQSEAVSLYKNESRVTSHESRVTVRAPASPEVIKELEDIAEQTRKCRKCELGSLRKNAVPGEGNTSARLMFVGEAPGADEDTQGRPFVGRAGQLLDKIITACGLKRQDVWIGNILKCRPPDNRDPKPEEIIACIPYLQRQIELINPEIIVALGAHAAKTFWTRLKQ